MKIKIILPYEQSPSINEKVFALNDKGYVGIAIFNGKNYEDIHGVRVNITHWIKFEG